MERRTNERGFKEHFKSGRHLKLDDLREEARRLANLEHLPFKKYLFNRNIPTYPRPEFHVSHLKHDTERRGLRGIWKDLGFKNLHGRPLVWWSVAVGPEEITSAERRILETDCPDQNQDQDQDQDQAARQQSFLWKFATSPAFLKTSRLGSYRFTFPLREVLKAYSQQFCCGKPPVMRVYETVLYKQEVMYVVLVHSPNCYTDFSMYPLLSDDPDGVCSYRDGRFIWRSQAMCETHSYKLVHRRDVNLMEAQELYGKDGKFYVWDHFAVALHVPQSQVLKFDSNWLRQNLKFCRPGEKTIISESGFDSYKDAQKLVRRLWPDCESPLEEASSLEQSLMGGQTAASV